MPRCQYCDDAWHKGICPLVKAIEYQPDGFTVKRVELHDRRADLAIKMVCVPILPPGTLAGLLS